MPSFGKERLTLRIYLDKQVEPKMIGVELADLNAGSRGIQLGEW